MWSEGILALRLHISKERIDRYLQLLTQNGILLIWGIIFQWITCLTTVHWFVFLYYLVWSWFFFLDNFLLCHGNTWQQCWRASIPISVWLLQYTIRKALVREAIFFLFLILTFHNKESTAVTNKRMHMRQHAEHLVPSNWQHGLRSLSFINNTCVSLLWHVRISAVETGLSA